MQLPTDKTARKNIPLARGLLDYFPAALAEVARLSQVGNEQHNPGEEMHHARGKSNDHADCIMRHLTDRGCEDTDGFLHDVKVAWRALAMLQERLEERGARFARGARADAEYLEDLFDLRTIHERRNEETVEVDALAEKVRVAVLEVLEGEEDKTLDRRITDDDEPEVDAYGRPLSANEPFTFTDEEIAEMRDSQVSHLCDYTGKICDPDAPCITERLDEDGPFEREADFPCCDFDFPGRTEPAEGFAANCISNRIAGDSAEAKDIKNPYYKHDPTVIKGYCAYLYCNKELLVDDECLVNNPGFDGSVIFCGIGCRIKHLNWQGRGGL